MSQPHLIEVNPHMIKFSPRNPRKHQGAEFLRIKMSVKEVGVVQMPTVRVLSGGFYECIDGEGRVRAAQEANLAAIWVVNLGIVNDHDALMMLQAANTVRSFSYLAECRGLANLHRQGQTADSIARSVGTGTTMIRNAIAIGYFPEQILAMIQEDIMQSETEGRGGKQNPLWSINTLIALLPLRTQIKERPANETAPLDGLYDYTEVRLAVEKIICGDIATREQLLKYIEQRRRELFEERFNKELQRKLQEELAQAHQALKESYMQKLQDVQEQTAQRYEAQVNLLHQQFSDLDKRHQEIVKEVAKRPEIVEKREKELQQKLQETETERLRLQQLQRQVQEEARATQRQLQQNVQSQVEAALQEQRAALEQELTRTRADLEAYYAQRDRDRQLQAEKSVRQAVAHGVELLAQSQQWLTHITSPNFVKGISWLRESEVMGLLAEIRTVRDSLEAAEEVIKHGEQVPLAVEGSVVSNQNGQSYQNGQL